MEMAPAEGRREGAAATVEMREGGGGVAGTGIERSTGEVECRVVTGDDLREEMGKPATSSCARWGGGGAAGVGEEAGRPPMGRRRGGRGWGRRQADRRLGGGKVGGGVAAVGRHVFLLARARSSGKYVSLGKFGGGILAVNMVRREGKSET